MFWRGNGGRSCGSWRGSRACRWHEEEEEEEEENGEGCVVWYAPFSFLLPSASLLLQPFTIEREKN